MNPSIPAAFGTGLGLAAGAGLNAYAVLLVYGVIAHFFPEEYPGAIARILGSTTALLVVAGLFLLEFFADKIPVLDHVWDVLHSVIRPVAGAVLAIASMEPQSDTALSVVAGGAGGVTALASHLVKAATRVSSTALTGGVANIALSIAEDVMAFVQALVSMFLPLVALTVVACFGLLFIFTVPRIARKFDLLGRRRPKPPGSPPSGEYPRVKPASS